MAHLSKWICMVVPGAFHKRRLVRKTADEKKKCEGRKCYELPQTEISILFSQKELINVIQQQLCWLYLKSQFFMKIYFYVPSFL